MDLANRCLRLCGHIKTLTNIHTTVIELHSKSFLTAPFLHSCKLKNTNNCEAFLTHLYGAYEAERWDGKYIYYCPRGLVFIATPPLINGTPMEYCIITGPFIMSNSKDEPFEDPACFPSSLEKVPLLSTAQARSLSELITAAVFSLTIDTLPSDVDSGNQTVILQMMHDIYRNKKIKTYPIEEEQQLQQAIRLGDKATSQEFLNQILCYIYYTANNDQKIIISRIRELLVLMSRAAIDGGADMDEIFNLCYRYEKEVDSFPNIESLNRWIGAIMHKFVSFVFDLKKIKHRNIIFKTRAYIKDHLTDKLTLEQAAGHVHLSKSYFCHILRDELGCTFTEYVNRLRIERSKVLLRSTQLPISEIAFSVGFDDQSYFNRIFKKQVGIAPGQFRIKRSAYIK